MIIDLNYPLVKEFGWKSCYFYNNTNFKKLCQVSEVRCVVRSQGVLRYFMVSSRIPRRLYNCTVEKFNNFIMSNVNQLMVLHMLRQEINIHTSPRPADASGAQLLLEFLLSMIVSVAFYDLLLSSLQFRFIDLQICVPE